MLNTGMFLEYSAFLFRAGFKILILRVAKSDLQRENLLLIRENQILKRKMGRVQLTALDPDFYLSISGYSRKLLKSVVIVRPETILGWHRKIVAWKWNQPSKRMGRPPLSQEIRKLVLEINQSNPRWGSQRIMAEVLKLDLKICKASVIKILREAGYDPWDCRTGPSWKGFMKSHGKRLMARDFFMLDVSTRKIVHWAVKEAPDANWLRNQFRSFLAFAEENDKPELLIADRDGLYRGWMGPFLKAHYGIELRATPPGQPIFNCFAERMVGTFRRELVDQMLIFSEKDLSQMIRVFVEYYNRERLHAGLGFRTPIQASMKSSPPSSPGQIQAHTLLDGLVTYFSKAA